ncbi:MAG: universal stress protein [Bacteroidota bacterium]|nr:universal stress protein [Bacteroidota bacterium]MDX5427685.1 universal stress protein [Bacteroidota bacterium]MDX5449124.1 universal stress protein [Bacteroidota bacterium]MDX5505582.1 universal stress protein [Bacteroidota bacterium]
MKPFTNIVIAVDLSPVTDVLIDYAQGILSPGGKLWVVHVAAPEPDFVGYGVGPQYIREGRAEQLKEEHERLSEIKEQVLAKGLNCESLLIQGPTVQTLVDEAQKLKADLILVAKHSRGFIEKLILGSTTKNLVESTKTPVLVIPSFSED